MTFKLIREANTINRLGDKADIAKKVQQALGIDSIVPVAEAITQSPQDYGVTPADYQEWLNAILDIAQEEGINLNKKNDFMDLAHDLLDNDSRVDALGFGDQQQRAKQNIVKVLWQTYQVSKAHSKVQQTVGGAIRAAHEDEEEVEKLVGCEDEQTTEIQDAFDDATGVVGMEDEEEFADYLKFARDNKLDPDSRLTSRKFSQKNPMNPRMEDQLDHAVRQRKFKNAGVNPYQPNTLRAALWDQRNAGSAEDEEHIFNAALDEFPSDGEVVDDFEVSDDIETADADLSADDLADRILQDVGRLEDRVDDLEQQVRGGDVGTDDVASAPVTSRGFDDEEQAKNMFRQAITAPKEHLSAALKDVEAEGSKAFQALSMPQNPHPKKSPAYNAWAKGFKSAAKSALGFAEQRREFPSKHRGKRK